MIVTKMTELTMKYPSWNSADERKHGGLSLATDDLALFEQFTIKNANRENCKIMFQEEPHTGQTGPHCQSPRGSPGTPYNGLYGERSARKGYLFRLEVYKRVGISRVGV